MKNITIRKQIILPVLLFLMMGTLYAFSLPKSDKTVSQEVGFTFGKILCMGTGLCSVMPPSRFPGNSFDAMGEIVIDENGKSSFRIRKNSISVAKAEEQFGNQFFEINKPLELLPSLGGEAQRRGGKPIIEKGRFPITEDSEYYTISF